MRISVQEQDTRSRAFALRGRNSADDRIIGLSKVETAELIRHGLRCAGIDESEWERLLNDEQQHGPDGVPTRTIWNRPGLTVAGTARGIQARWEAACTPKE